MNLGRANARPWSCPTWNCPIIHAKVVRRFHRHRDERLLNQAILTTAMTMRHRANSDQTVPTRDRVTMQGRPAVRPATVAAAAVAGVVVVATAEAMIVAMDATTAGVMIAATAGVRGRRKTSKPN
jgi:hypothetical protein